MKRGFVSIPWREFPTNLWMTVILLQPGDASLVTFPGAKEYISLKARFDTPYMPRDKIFDLRLPLLQFRNEVLAFVPPDMRKDDQQYQVDILKDHRKRLKTRNWKLLDEPAININSSSGL